MVTVLALLGVVVVLFLTAVVATRADPLLAAAPRDRPDVVLPDGPLQGADVGRLRFPVVLRGYRMSDVDAVLDRLAAELDRRIAELDHRDGRITGRSGPEPAGPGDASRPTE